MFLVELVADEIAVLQDVAQPALARMGLRPVGFRVAVGFDDESSKAAAIVDGEKCVGRQRGSLRRAVPGVGNGGLKTGSGALQDFVAGDVSDAMLSAHELDRCGNGCRHVAVFPRPAGIDGAVPVAALFEDRDGGRRQIIDELLIARIDGVELLPWSVEIGASVMRAALMEEIGKSDTRRLFAYAQALGEFVEIA